jgi:Cu/Ag efflux protein CusF
LQLIPAAPSLVEAEIGDRSTFGRLLSATIPDNGPPSTLVDALPMFLNELNATPESAGWFVWYGVRLATEHEPAVLVCSGGFKWPPRKLAFLSEFRNVGRVRVQTLDPDTSICQNTSSLWTRHMNREHEQNDPFRDMPQWPKEANDPRPAAESRASRFWSWWLGEHLTPLQKILLVVFVLPPALLMVVLKLSWDAENRAKAQRDWVAHQERIKKLDAELQRLQKENERYRPFVEAAARRMANEALARANADDAKATGFCAMHPQVVRENCTVNKSEPAFTNEKCPICLMPLVRVHQIKLCPQEKQLVADQAYVCPIDGVSIFVGTAQSKINIKGKTVFVCCKDCANKALANPDKTLTALEERKRQFSKDYEITARVVAIDLEERSLTLTHDNIPGLVPAGQRRFAVQQANLMQGIQEGDSVRGRLTVRSGAYILIELEKR